MLPGSVSIENLAQSSSGGANAGTSAGTGAGVGVGTSGASGGGEMRRKSVMEVAEEVVAEMDKNNTAQGEAGGGEEGEGANDERRRSRKASVYPYQKGATKKDSMINCSICPY